MALFFDQTWFDERLKTLGKSHDDLASEMGLPLAELVAVWKDQRELSVDDVAVLADVLLTEPAEISKRAGISTPVPQEPQTQLTDLLERIRILEARVAVLEASILKKK